MSSCLRPWRLRNALCLSVVMNSVGGLKPVITKVREMIELPLKHPELFDRQASIHPPRLLHGPPGTQERQCSPPPWPMESDAYFISINGPEIMSKYYARARRLCEIYPRRREKIPLPNLHS